MNLFVELEKLTMPAGGASKARRLTSDEIEQLLLEGEITPLEKIKASRCRREGANGNWGRRWPGRG